MAKYSPTTTALIAGAMTIAAFVIGYVASLATSTGLFRSLEPTTQQCRRIGGIVGPEDIDIDYDRGLAYITHADRYSVFAEQGPPDGDIKLLDLNAPRTEPVSLASLPPSLFFPHGLSLWIGPDGERRLFVVNHGKDGKSHSVEVFRVTDEGRSLDHIESVRDPLMVSPNDVAAAGPDSFYITNDVMAQTEPWRTLEAFMQPKTGNIVYVPAERPARIVAGRLRYGNGIILGPEGDHLYAAAVTGQRIYAYRRNGEDGSLDLDWVLPTPMGVDNLTFDEDGDIWAAGHPRPLEFTQHAKSPRTVPSASEVARIRIRSGAPEWKTVFLDRGDKLSGSSVAARYGDRILVGAVYSRHILDCRLTQ